MDSERISLIINSCWSKSLALFRPHAGKNGIHGDRRANLDPLVLYRPETLVSGAVFFLYEYEIAMGVP